MLEGGGGVYWFHRRGMCIYISSLPPSVSSPSSYFHSLVLFGFPSPLLFLLFLLLYVFIPTAVYCVVCCAVYFYWDLVCRNKRMLEDIGSRKRRFTGLWSPSLHLGE